LRSALYLVICLFSLLPLQATEEARSPRNANYEIDVQLHPERKMLEARGTIEWRNLQEVGTDELWFHLYWNAWRNNLSTWMQEDRAAGRSRNRRTPPGPPEREDWSWTEVRSLALIGEDGERTPLPTRFESPDDGNVHDRTVLVATLPRLVMPEETIRLEIEWESRIPRTFARTGHRGNFYFIAQWFPKLGVFEADGWNCHQFHATTEFYSDYGVYDVRISVPAGFVIGATGREASRAENPDGSVTHRYRQADVHDFVWTASPDYVVRTRRFAAEGSPPVEMRLLIQPEHLRQADRHFDATEAAIEHFGRWYGPYPYGHVTIVDPAYGSGAGGMEYPTLFTSGTRRFNPFGGDSPESVTVHEMGHQFWYGVVGNNEFESAWLDEGLNSYSTERTLNEAYDDRVLTRRYFSNFFPFQFRDIEVPRRQRGLDRYRRHWDRDRPSKHSFLYDPSSSASLTYSKTALWLQTLERYLGWETFQPAMSTFYERYSFKHPRPEDFFDTIQEVAGQDLRWFFDQVHDDSVVFDYAVTEVSSRRGTARGWGDGDAEGEPQRLDPDSDDSSDDSNDSDDDDGSGLYRSKVTVRRLGGGVFPVKIKIVFKDDHQIEEQWDGVDRHRTFTYDRVAKLSYAFVDPQRVLTLDVDPTNNSRMRKEKSRLPAMKWGSKWMLWFQDRMSLLSFFL